MRKTVAYKLLKQLFQDGNRDSLMYYAYILKSRKDEKFYYGTTKDLDKRIKSHNSGKVRSTKTRRPLELLYSEEFECKTESLRRENFFKSLSGYRWLKKEGVI